MRSDYRFLRIRQSGTRFAKVTIEALSANDWEIAMSSDLRPVPERQKAALLSGIQCAVLAHRARRPNSRFKVLVCEVVETVADTTDDALECASAIATWKAFGHSEGDAVLDFVGDRWAVRFSYADES